MTKCDRRGQKGLRRRDACNLLLFTFYCFTRKGEVLSVSDVIFTETWELLFVRQERQEIEDIIIDKDKQANFI